MNKLTYTMRTQDYNYKHDELNNSVFFDHLNQFRSDVWDFIVLEPSEPVNGSTFIQVGAPDEQTDFKMTVELGIDNPERIEMYRYYTEDKNEVFQMLKDYLEKQEIPQYEAWEDISREMNR